MEISKEEYIGKLYSLRAGLSTVLKEKESYDRLYYQAKDKGQQQIKQVKSEIKKLNKEEKELTKEIEKNKSYLERTIVRKKNDTRYSLILGILFLILLVPLIYAICYFVFVDNFEMYKWANVISNGNIQRAFWPAIVMGLVIAASGILGFICFIMFCYFMYERNNYFIESDKKRLAEREEKLAVLQHEMSGYPAKLADAEKQAKELLNDKEIVKHYNAGKAMFSSLIPVYNEYLDCRDWENLDGMIFALETGRAQNKVEALNFIDKERRNSNLTNAIHAATESINENIRVNINSVKNMISSSVEILGRHITENTKLILNSNLELSCKLDDQERYMSQVVSQANMSNALIEKSNKSSDEIVKSLNEFNRLNQSAYNELVYNKGLSK